MLAYIADELTYHNKLEKVLEEIANDLIDQVFRNWIELG